MTEAPKRECINFLGLERICVDQNVIIFLKGMRGSYVEGTVLRVSEYGIMVKVKDKKRLIKFSEIKMIEAE